MQNKDFLISLKSKNTQIRKDLARLKLLMPNTTLARQLFYISEKFELMNQAWENLVNRVQVGVKGLRDWKEKVFCRIKKCEQGVKEIGRQERRVRSQEIAVGECERLAGRSLRRVRRLWRKSLDYMDRSIAGQAELNEKVREKYSMSADLLDSEFDQAVEGSEESLFYIEKSEELGDSVGRYRKLFMFKDDQVDLGRLGQAEYSSEDIEWFRKHNKKGDVGKARQKFKGRRLDRQISPDSQGLSGSVDIQEVKQALLVLKKANLLEKNQKQTLINIANLIKSSENTSNFELVLQLIDLESRKNEKTKEKIIKKSQRSKAKNFKFFLDDSITKGFPFTDNDLSSSNSNPKGLTNVKLEDLLEISPFFEDLGLISADNSLIDDLNEGVIITEGRTVSKEGFGSFNVQITE